VSHGTWPRPSDSRRVRLTLHLLEGVLVGGALVLGAGLLLGLSRVAGGLIAADPLSVLLFLLVVVALARAGLSVAADRGSGPEPDEPYRDWQRVRRPRLVGTVAMPVTLALLAAAFVLGRGATAVRLVGASTLLLGVLGYAFALRWIGVRL
jgi:hypothetical protein